MAKQRVHELAKEMGIASKEMVTALQGMGLDIKNHFSTIDDAQVDWIRKNYHQELKKLSAFGAGQAAANKTDSNAKNEMEARSGAKAEIKEPLKPDEPTAMAAQPDKRQTSGRSSGDKRQDVRPQPTHVSARRHVPRTQSADEVAAPPSVVELSDEPKVTPTPVVELVAEVPKIEPAPPEEKKVIIETVPIIEKKAEVEPIPVKETPIAPATIPSVEPKSDKSGKVENVQARPKTTPGPQPTRTGSPSPSAKPTPSTTGQRPSTGGPGNRPPGGGPQHRPENRLGDRNRNNQGQDNRPQQGRGPRPSGEGAGRPANQPKRPDVPAPSSPPKGAVPGKTGTGDNRKGPGGASKHKTTQQKKPEYVKQDYSRPTRKGKPKRKKEDAVLSMPELISVGDFIQVRDLADKLNKSSGEIMKKLMELGIMATINQEVDFETIEILCSLMGVDVERELSEEQKLFEEIVDSPESLKPRFPIVTVMGHVDHGKTSLLDRIRQTNVVSGEAGGITQHIGAYQVNVNENRITFIDTPGHEAFTAMRARGANLTDIVILVVAVDDGVMPQTVEAISHIKAANVPFLVALNKIDKPDINPDKIRQQLTEYSIVDEEWGGDTMFVPVSAKTGIGIEDLLERVLLLSEINELKANPDRPAEGVVIEGKLDRGRGPVATVLIQKGTLKLGDSVICGSNWARVRAMTDYRGQKVETAPPSMPVEITGWSGVPEAGERVQACDEKVAKELVSLRLNERKLEEQKKSSRVSLDEFFQQMQDAEIKELNLILKGDVQGSVEALAQSLLRLSTNEVKVHVIHSGVGAVTESDIMLASASNAIILGFNVRPDVKARKYAEDEGIDVRLYRVIYEAIDDVKKAMTGLLDPIYREKYIGRAEVRATFKVPNIGTIGGSYVIEGKMQRNAEIRVLRDGVIIYEGKLSSLKRFKDDAAEVAENFECGIGIRDFNDIKEGDIIEAFIMEEIPREL